MKLAPIDDSDPRNAGCGDNATRTASNEGDLTPGRVIDNPISGEHIVIRVSSEQTNGDLLSFDLFLPPGAHVPARHIHPIQEESFTVVEGSMRFRLGRFGWHTILASPGDTVRIPPGTAHWFGNAGAGTAHAYVEARPALRTEEMLESAAAMRVVRYVPGTRTPQLSDLALFLIEFQRELAVPDIPAWVIRVILAPLVWFGRRDRKGTSGSVGGAPTHSRAMGARRGDDSEEESLKGSQA